MNEVKTFIKENLIISSNEKVVAAVSGGPDSMLLLTLLINELGSKNVVCAHVNHKVRKESDEEAKMVQEYCNKNNVTFEYMEINDYCDDNFHNDARNKRYDFFKKVLKKYNSKYLLTAHHGDDLIETVLMRIVRGSTVKGYSGFKQINNQDGIVILRPLITLTKKEILDYCSKENIKYATDLSNTSDKYTRNRYRNHVLPFLKQEDSNVHNKFLKFSNNLSEITDYINELANDVLDKVYKDKVLDIELLKKESIVLQKKALNIILLNIYKEKLYLIDDNNIKDIIDLINSDKANASINLPQNIVVKKEYNKAIFENKVEKTNEYFYELVKKVELPNGKTIEIVNSETDNSNYNCKLNSNEVLLPLFIRTKKDGDYIEMLNTDGKQKVKDIFINKKIPLSERTLWPVLVDKNDNIIWIPGLKKSKYDKSKTQNYDIIIRYY